MQDDNHNNVAVFLRRDKKGKCLVAAVNFSPLAYEGYRFGVPACRELKEVFNTDEVRFGGSGVTNSEPAPVEQISSHGRDYSAAVRIPPLGAAFFVCSGKVPGKKNGKKSER